MPDEKDIAQWLATVSDHTLPEEVRSYALEQLLVHDDLVQAYLRKDFKAVLPTSEETVSEADRAYDRLRATLNVDDTARKRTVSMSRYFRWASIAAAVLLCIGGIWFFTHRAQQPVVATTATKPTKPLTPVILFDTIRNSGPSTSFHQLPDGSTVHLEAGSELVFRKAFAGGKKEIHLQGDALFTVHKDEQRPFSVFVRGIEVLDLGTVFSVAGKQQTIKVKLIQGKVLVRTADPQLNMQDVALAPGQEFRINMATKQYAVHTVTPAAEVRETRLARNLTFKNASLQEVFTTLEKECHVVIRFNKNELKDMAFTGTFDAGTNARNNIAMVCMINDLKYELRNNSIYIHR